MTTHFIEKCKHGTVKAQCRCGFSPKRVTLIPCPEHCPFKNPPAGSRLSELPSRDPDDMIDPMERGMQA